MSIHYHDTSILVMYLQIFLREYYGLTVEKVLPVKKSEEVTYRIVSNKTVKVTGSYNEQTYTSIALYMHYLYPKEKYPYLWIEDKNGTWKAGESSQTAGFTYKRNLIFNSLELSLIKILEGGDANQISKDMKSLVKSTYHLTDEDFIRPTTDGSISSYNVLVKEDLEELISRFEEDNYSQLYDDSVIYVISKNLESLQKDTSAIDIPTRIMSYVFGEVVSKESSPEEVIRAKKLIFGDPIFTEDTAPYIYTEDLTEKISTIQKNYIDRYTVNGETKLPEGFEGFKVTGYLDPWTELLVKRGEM